MRKPKSIRPWHPVQTTLLPKSPTEQLTEDHLVILLLDLVDTMILSIILDPAQGTDTRGVKEFDPSI